MKARTVGEIAYEIQQTMRCSGFEVQENGPCWSLSRAMAHQIHVLEKQVLELAGMRFPDRVYPTPPPSAFVPYHGEPPPPISYEEAMRIMNNQRAKPVTMKIDLRPAIVSLPDSITVKRRPPNVEVAKCDCGGEKAQTTHATWCALERKAKR